MTIVVDAWALVIIWAMLMIGVGSFVYGMFAVKRKFGSLIYSIWGYLLLLDRKVNSLVPDDVSQLSAMDDRLKECETMLKSMTRRAPR